MGWFKNIFKKSDNSDVANNKDVIRKLEVLSEEIHVGNNILDKLHDYLDNSNIVLTPEQKEAINKEIIDIEQHAGDRNFNDYIINKVNKIDGIARGNKQSNSLESKAKEKNEENTCLLKSEIKKIETERDKCINDISRIDSNIAMLIEDKKRYAKTNNLGEYRRCCLEIEKQEYAKQELVIKKNSYDNILKVKYSNLSTYNTQNSNIDYAGVARQAKDVGRDIEKQADIVNPYEVIENINYGREQQKNVSEINTKISEVFSSSSLDQECPTFDKYEMEFQREREQLLFSDNNVGSEKQKKATKNG